ncbi:MAG: hypothetical protein GF400_08775, partial [Candidatus Eisenbacteria bacterium]|nr:hypothetical protein [Candidatus Eisenbacteria bacterium]
MSFRTILIATALATTLTVPVAARTNPDDGFVITAEEVEGAGAEDGRVIHLAGNVTITRGEATLVGQRGTYYEARGLAVVFGDVRGVDGESTISCDTLRYYRDLDRAYLIGNATYSDTSGVTRARRINIYRPERLAVCLGDAVAVDHDGTFELSAGRILYDFDREEARASEAPVMRTFDDEGAQEGRLSAALIELSPGDDRIAAFGGAEIATADVSARSRLAVLSGEGDSVELLGDPVVDQDGDLLSGERILVFLSEGEVSRVVALDGARVDYTIESESPSDPDQTGHVDGDTLRMYFEDGEPVLTTVRGGATSEHRVAETGERNTVASREIDVLFFEGEIRRVVFRGKASGVYVFASDETPAEDAAAAPREG